MKKLLPILVALLGLGAGVAAGVVLKPAPPETHAAAGHDPCATEPAADGHAAPAEAHGEQAPAHGEEATEAEHEAASEPCVAPEDDPFAKVEPAADDHGKEKGEYAFVPLDKPFVVPVFRGDSVTAMVVMSLSVAVDKELEPKVKALQPRLRDSFLAVLFRHANSGGFDGSYTSGQKMEDLKAALLISARDVVEKSVSDVLITEIARQDV